MRPVALIAPVLFALPAAAADDARAFMDEVFNRSSWKDMHGSVRLVLENKRGDTKVREIRMWSKTNEKDENSMLMRFVEPADVRGTGFLVIEHDDGEDDRRLFLPALRRAQRISASGSGGNFMSSDFTYYDVGMPKLADWTYAFTDGKTLDGDACRGVEARAANDKVKEDTGYARVIWYVDPSRKIALGADDFDEAGLPLKSLVVKKVEIVSGVPFATHMVVEDNNTGHKSEMMFRDLKTDTGIGDDVFTERNLRRWRR
jgi:hypothetical protein